MSEDPITKKVKYCPYCGEELQELQEYCPGCGVKLSDGSGNKEVKGEVEPSVQPPIAVEPNHTDTFLKSAPQGLIAPPPNIRGIRCIHCKGTGFCKFCHGAGSVNRVECAQCRGTGRCAICYGRGVL